jgi:hypothetical protein
VKDEGILFGAEMSRALLACGAPGLHYYTLNLEVGAEIVVTTTKATRSVLMG